METLSDYISLIDLVDIAAFVAVALMMLMGIRRGLSGELAGMVSAVAGFLFGVLFFSAIVDWMMEHSRLGYESARLVTFVAVMLISISVMLVLRIVLHMLLKLAIDKKTDRWGGGLAGVLKGVIIVLAIFVLMILSPVESARRTFGDKSMIGVLLLKAVPELKDGAHTDMETGDLGIETGPVMELIEKRN